MRKRIVLFIALALSFLITAATAVAATGTGPSDAIAPNNGTQTVAANSAQWYTFELGGKKADVTVTLETATADGVRLQIYTPAQIAAYQNGEKLKAIGVGSEQQAHSLAWYGEFHQSGTYYALVNNDTGAPVQ